MAEYTQYLGLEKPDTTEYYNVSVFNNNADMIDGVIQHLLPSIVDGVLYASNWIDGVQTVTVSGVTYGSTGDLYSAPTATAEQDEAFNDAQLKVTDQSTNSLTITARGTVPSIDLPIQVEVRNVL